MKASGKPILFGHALKKLREEAGLTQEQLAERSRVNRATIADLEANPDKQPRWGTIVGLAAGLGISLDSFADAAMRYVEPPLDRLESLESRLSALEGSHLETTKDAHLALSRVQALQNELSALRRRRGAK